LRELKRARRVRRDERRGARSTGGIAAQPEQRHADADGPQGQGWKALGCVERVSSVSRAVVQYLDPTSCVLPQRIDRLTRPNGDLDTLLAKHLRDD
jgi:hypothetical protein